MLGLHSGSSLRGALCNVAEKNSVILAEGPQVPLNLHHVSLLRLDPRVEKSLDQKQRNAKGECHILKQQSKQSSSSISKSNRLSDPVPKNRLDTSAIDELQKKLADTTSDREKAFGDVKKLEIEPTTQLAGQTHFTFSLTREAVSAPTMGFHSASSSARKERLEPSQRSADHAGAKRQG